MRALGGIALGTVAGAGLAILVFVFGLPPGMPPRTVLGMILCVITATASMQAAGGLDYLVGIADAGLRAKPRAITFIAPVVVYAFVFLSGTGHVTYSLLPVIGEVSRSAGVRPERPMSVAAVTSLFAVMASPIAGLGWIGSSFFEGNRPAIVGAISHVVKGAPWLFAVGVFALSVLLFS